MDPRAPRFDLFWQAVWIYGFWRGWSGESRIAETPDHQ